MADEAERLATIVSYARDKSRLRQQAETWREQADALRAEHKSTLARDAGFTSRSVMSWFRRSRV